MIKLLFALILSEMVLTMSLMFQTPLRKLVVIAFDLAKQGRGPLVAKSVGGTMLVVFISTLYGIMDIQRRSVDAGVVNPTDQVLAYSLQ
ncbi:hypothetical protein RJ641_000443 [Dillenia turbinata]|uniref:Endoplasmic reticulum transmembrane protein n=1 Tax=Dillenia turbinata TaxID=194707 RepID=A0AAN8W6P6_9MAGN